MNDQSWMWHLPILPDTRNAISSPASADGLSPPGSPVGLTTASCGPAPRRASRSRSQDSSAAPMTIGTCGPISSDSSQQDGLPSCSVSKSPSRREQNVKKDHRSNERSKAWREKNPERSKAIAKSSRTANRAGNMIADAKKRAKQKGLAFDLEDFRDQLTTRINAGLCELTGMQLRLSGGPRDWDTPSLDRIVPELGYTISNVRVIAFGLNVMMLTWGLDRAMSIMDALKAKEAERNESFQGRFAAALERRLRPIGSTECNLIYTHSVTPAGRRLFHVVPSMRPTDVTACGLWPTPTASLADKAIRTPEGARTEVERGKSPDLNAQVVAACWPTPTSTDASRGFGTIRPQDTGIPLPQRVAQVVVAAEVALYPTPRASANENRTTKIPPSQLDGRRGLYLSSVAIGMEPDGSSATTEKPGALNPEFVCWLMGFPPEWDACAPTAMQSSRKSRPK